MEIKLKERVIGALVLVAIGVLVLPWLLDEDKSNGVFVSKIPAPPETPAVRVVDLTQPRPQQELAQDQAIIAVKAEVEPEPVAPTIPDKNADLVPTEASVQHQIASTTSTEPSESPALADGPAPASSAQNLPPLNGNGKNPPAAENAVKPPTTTTTSNTVPKALNTTTHAVAANPAVTGAKDIKKTASGPVMPALPANIAAKGFVIQLGSFGNSDNAKKLVDKLKSNGFKAYSRNESHDGQTLVRVLVGPYMEQKMANAELPKVKPLAGNVGMVVPFDPLKH